jgi:hypothetical protein
MRIDEAKLRERAYQLWEQEGRPEGATQSHWRQAAAQLQAEAEAANADGPSTVDTGVGGMESGVAQPRPKP